MVKDFKPGIRVVDEMREGVYVWQMPDGKWVADEDGNWLCIASVKGDIRKIEMLNAAARAYGLDEGTPYFLAGHRLISDEEYEQQNQRLKFGLVPDEYDVPAMVEELKHAKSR